MSFGAVTECLRGYIDTYCERAPCKISLVAVGVLLLVGGAIAFGCRFPTIGYPALACGVGLIILALCQCKNTYTANQPFYNFLPAGDDSFSPYTT